MRDDVINLIGMPVASHGLGRDLRDKAHGLLDLGTEVDIAEVNFSSLTHTVSDEKLTARITSVPRGRVNLICLSGPMYQLALRDFPQLFEGRINVLQPFWEFSDLPASLVEALNHSDEIWVPTSFMANAFRRYARPKVMQIPSATELDEPSARDFRAELAIADDELMLLQSFHCNSLVVRKDPEASILAFLEAFGKRPEARVRLVLKYAWEEARSLDRRQMDAFLALAQKDDRILPIDASLDNNDMAALMHAADVYVSPHRCEGLGRGILEAMQAGKTVIATDYSGAADQIRPHILALPFEMVKVGPHAHGGITPELDWAQPDFRKLSDHFDTLERDRSIVTELGQRAREGIKDISGRRLFAKAALTRIEAIRTAPAGNLSRFRLDSGERQIGADPADIREDHRFRYQWAIDRIREHFTDRPIGGGADFLCGTGYGTSMLRALAPIWAFDASVEAISIARRAFNEEGISYEAGSFPGIAPPGPFDFVVALEAVEHISDYRKFIELIACSLSEGGMAVLSTPDEAHLPWNPVSHKFHIRHFTPRELTDICAEFGLVCTGFAGQNIYALDQTHTKLLEPKDMIPVEGNRGQFSLFAFSKTATSHVEPSVPTTIANSTKRSPKGFGKRIFALVRQKLG